MLNKPAHKKIAQARGCDEPVLSNTWTLCMLRAVRAAQAEDYVAARCARLGKGEKCAAAFAELLLNFGDALAEGLHGELGLFGVDH